jgi:hypothetical protein
MVVRALRCALRAFLRMRKALDIIKKIPHLEEAAKQPSRRTHVADLQLNPNSFTSAGAGMTVAAGIGGLGTRRQHRLLPLRA